MFGTEENLKKVVDFTNVQGKGCLGCLSVSKDIMITYTLQDDSYKDFHDIFLTNEQAEELINQIQLRIKQNKEEEL